MSDKAINDIFAQLMGEDAGDEPIKTASEESKKETVKVGGVNLSEDELGVLTSFLSEHEEDEKRAEEEKVAQEAFVQGQIMARGFMAELDKIAAGEGGYDENQTKADPSTKDMAAGAAVGGVPNEASKEKSTVDKQTKKINAVQEPASPTKVEDVVKVVKKVVQAASDASKGQDRQEVPNNLGVAETATS